jgi:hypothetical protein
MGLASPEAAPAARSVAVRGSAFGVDVASGSPLDGLAAATGGRSTAWHAVDADALAAVWDERSATPVVDLRYAGGRTFLRVDRAGDDTYRIVTPRHGRHVVRADGREIWSLLPPGSAARWQRLLFAQPLPLAAGLQELELFHASAVAVGGRTIGLVASSGTGKSSIAAHLVAAGAGFVTDDVLALEPSNGRVLAFPGPARLAITAGELRSVPQLTRPRLGPVVGRTDKLIAAPPASGPAGPLAALVFLSRSAAHASLRIVDDGNPSPQRLLGSAFLPYLDRPERLLRRLDLCARVGADLAYVEVEIPQAARTADVAEALLNRLERL